MKRKPIGRNPIKTTRRVPTWDAPIRMALDGTIGKAIEEYTGGTLIALSCYADPKVVGTYAFRAMFEGPTSVQDFLVMGVPLAKVTHEDLEEVDFETWPPVSGGFSGWLVS